MALRVVELFAGVGGFRQGLQDCDLQAFETVFWNQWEPGIRAQHAWQCYVEHFHDGVATEAPPFSNVDICQVPTDAVPEHDLLVGGFPCQDYSVATTLDKAGGIQGRKGVLWWQIDRLLSRAKPPAYLLLENVDRLLKSPANQRGRDFAIVLACLRDRGYHVEWRVINAADYGNAQRRRRVFIFGARKDTSIGRFLASKAASPHFLQTTSFFAEEFPASYEVLDGEAHPAAALPKDIRQISANFAQRFHNAGVMVEGKVWTRHVNPRPERQAVLGKHVEKGAIPERYFLDSDRIKDWEYAKGPKREPRTAKNGHEYLYSEGGMQFPDLLEAPGRTVLTSEGNRTPNRSTHVIEDPATGRLRFLMPVEVERLMGFPPGWTVSLPERWRYFTMGNALVVPLVTRMGSRLLKWVQTHEKPVRKAKPRAKVVAIKLIQKPKRHGKPQAPQAVASKPKRQRGRRHP